MNGIPDMSPYYKLISGYNCIINKTSGVNSRYINFDNAATTPPLLSILSAVNGFCPWYSSIHRGVGYKSVFSSKKYEGCRINIMKFVGANIDSDTLIFVKNTTEGINKLSFILENYIGDGIVLISQMEHHSNLLPWRSKYNVDYVKVDENGRLLIDDLESKLKAYGRRVKLLAITAASNVTGYINPVNKIAELCHKYGVMILVDGAQFIPHNSFSMHSSSNVYVDFLVFSGHKMYAPFGSGVLIGPKEIFMNAPPEYSGGGTVKIVTDNAEIWDDPPYKNEAGTPNILGALAINEAVNSLQKLNMKNIERYESMLLKYTINKLSNIPDIILYSDYKSHRENQCIISFNIKDIPHYITAKILSDEGCIGVRSGCFCAQPYVQKLLKMSQSEIDYYLKHPEDIKRPGMVRVSYGMYNGVGEIDVLLSLLSEIVKNKKYYLKKYYKS